MGSAVVRVAIGSLALSSRRGDCDELTRGAEIGLICLSSWRGCSRIGRDARADIGGTELDHAPGAGTVLRRSVGAPVAAKKGGGPSLRISVAS